MITCKILALDDLKSEIVFGLALRSFHTTVLEEAESAIEQKDWERLVKSA